MKEFSRRYFLRTLGLGMCGSTVLPAASALSLSAAQVSGYSGRKLNVALCGLGRYANVLREGLLASKFCRLAGIVTGTPEKAKKWQSLYDIPQKNIYNYQNFDRIAKNKEIDLVYVVLPNSMHKEFTIRAAKAGKHVIVEKPMAITEADCLQMIEACKEAGVQLAMGYRLHFEPHHIEIKRLGQEKVFGPVKLIEASLGYPLKGAPPDDWHFKKALSGGGPLMNLGVYCVQSARYVLGEEPVYATAQLGPVTMPELFQEVEESITWQLYFASGAVCSSSATSTCHIDRFYASAEKGFFELSPGLSYGPFKGSSTHGKFDFPVINQQAAQLDAIGKTILDKRVLPSHISGEEGSKDVKVLEGIYEAARTGKKFSFV